MTEVGYRHTKKFIHNSLGFVVTIPPPWKIGSNIGNMWKAIPPKSKRK